MLQLRTAMDAKSRRFMAASVVKKRLGTDRQDCRFQLKPMGTAYLCCHHNAVPRRTRKTASPRLPQGGDGTLRFSCEARRPSS
jgi:hypothetical protein